MHRLALLLALSSCAAGPGSISGVGRGGGTSGAVAGEQSAEGIDCAMDPCGGTGNPVEIGIGIAVVVGVVLAGLWKQR
jgi:hypothetical protein